MRPPRPAAATVLPALCLLLAAGPGRGADPVPPAPPAVPAAAGAPHPAPLPTTLDSRRRFAVHGGAPDERAELVAWATATTDRFERHLGRRLPWPEGATYHLFIVHATNAPARIIARQEAARDAPWQEVTLVNPERCSLFELTLTFVRHLLVRAHYNPAQAARLVAAADRLPFWYVAGQARTMLAEYRSADMQAVLRQLREPDWPAPERLLAARTPEELTPVELAAVTVWFRWLREQPVFRTLEQAVWAEAAEGSAAWDAAHLGARLDPPRSARAVRQDWDLYLAGLRSLTLPREMNTRDLAFEIRRVVAVPRAHLPAPIPPEAPALLTPAGLVRLRARPWARALAGLMRDQLRFLPVAQDPRALEVARAHADLLDQLARPPARSVWKWLTIEAGEAELAARAQAAELALQALESDAGAAPEPPPADGAATPNPEAP